MRRALAAAGAALVLALAGCGGGGGDDEILEPEARAAADDFVRALVAAGNPVLAGQYAVPSVAERLQLWHSHLVRDGVRTVEGPGSARANCIKAFPVFAPPPPADCITYRLVGLMPVEGSLRTLATVARLRLWLTEGAGGWRVAEFDYTPSLEWR